MGRNVIQKVFCVLLFSSSLSLSKGHESDSSQWCVMAKFLAPKPHALIDLEE